MRTFCVCLFHFCFRDDNMITRLGSNFVVDKSPDLKKSIWILIAFFPIECKFPILYNYFTWNSVGVLKLWKLSLRLCHLWKLKVGTSNTANYYWPSFFIVLSFWISSFWRFGESIIGLDPFWFQFPKWRGPKGLKLVVEYSKLKSRRDRRGLSSFHFLN